MAKKIITYALKYRYSVLLMIAVFLSWGIYAVIENPKDAIPDMSENQVIVFTEWMGRSPQIIEDQITFPLVSNLQGIGGVKDIRASSMFGMSFIYVIFQESVDIIEARLKVLERLNYAQRALPEGVTPSLGPEGTGVGHILWYYLDAPKMSLGEQRALQDWYIKLALQSVEGVAEIASFGGLERQYQLIVNPLKMQYYDLDFLTIVQALRANNQDVGGGKMQQEGMAYVLRGLGYIQNEKDILDIALGVYKGVPVRVRDVAWVQMGGAARLGIFDVNGKAEVVGGIVVMRYGENARRVIDRVKEKMEELKRGLPDGVNFSFAYDRSELINESIRNIVYKLIEEMLAVTLIVILFLGDWRSTLSIIIQIPITIAISFIPLQLMGVTSNIMSLTGIALAIGVIVDNGIIMSENAHRSWTQYKRDNQL